MPADMKAALAAAGGELAGAAAAVAAAAAAGGEGGAGTPWDTLTELMREVLEAAGALTDTSMLV